MLEEPALAAIDSSAVRESSHRVILVGLLHGSPSVR